MSNSTNTKEVAVIIPDLRCDAPFSIKKLPIPGDVTMDTTNLANYYLFDDQDTAGSWSSESVSSVEGVISTEIVTVNGCTVARVDDSGNWTSIRWKYADSGQTSEISRWVTSPFEWPCYDPDDDDESLMTPAPVTYATNKPSYLPAPVFNPNQSAGGGGGTIEGLSPVLGQVTSVNYSRNEATVSLYGLDAGGNLVLTDEQVMAIII